ncbi:MAG: FAD:protein FMN transferase [Flavobacteriales bacterium]|nr:FAD:protein FMN transferase [Flavobacteriales bacterium]
MMPGTNSFGKSRLVRGFSFLLLGALFCACNAEEPWTTLKGEAQGTTFTITYLDSLGRDLSTPVDSLFRVVDHSLSLWDSTSTVTRFNAAADTFVANDRHFQVVLALSRQFWSESEGAFDPTVLPLVRAWGLGKEGRAALDTSSIMELRKCVGMDLIRWPPSWDGSRFRKEEPCVQFDPNGIAQGYTVDMLAMLLEVRGIDRYMVEVGGEVRASGTNERGTAWTIQIDKPMEGSEHVQQAVVPLAGRSMATSGNYRKFIEVGGKRYGHTIDPRTGRPAMNSLLSASVIANDCATADALATAMMVMGTEDAKVWLDARQDVEAYLITDDGRSGYEVWTTRAWPVTVP